MTEIEQMRHDLVFIAKMLSIAISNSKEDFFLCEAWEVAKKYQIKEEESNTN